MSVATKDSHGHGGRALCDVRGFEGPNRHLPERCIVGTLDTQAVAGTQGLVPPQAARRIHAFLEDNVRISPLTPPLAEVDRVLLADSPVPAADAVAATCIALQHLSGETGARWRVAPGDGPDLATLACACDALDIGAAALHTACELVAAASGGGPNDTNLKPPPSLRSFLALLRRRMLDFTSRCLVHEASRRGIPWRRVNDGLTSRLLIELGEGRRHTTMMGETSPRATTGGASPHSATAARTRPKPSGPSPKRWA